MINHHPSVEQLSCFAAGALPLSQALCISAHAEHCARCRRELRRLELVGAELFSVAGIDSDADALKDKLFARIDSLGADTMAEEINSVRDTAKIASTPGSDLPRCLQGLIPEGLDQVQWKRLSPSIQGAKLCTDVNGSKIELIRIKPGGQVASHNHTGEEITLVLAGSFSDANGVYGKGDIIFRGEEHKHHRPIASQDAECICLTSVEAPIQFTGFFARLLNPLVRRSHYAS